MLGGPVVRNSEGVEEGRAQVEVPSLGLQVWHFLDVKVTVVVDNFVKRLYKVNG